MQATWYGVAMVMLLEVGESEVLPSNSPLRAPALPLVPLVRLLAGLLLLARILSSPSGRCPATLWVDAVAGIPLLSWCDAAPPTGPSVTSITDKKPSPASIFPIGWPLKCGIVLDRYSPVALRRNDRVDRTPVGEAIPPSGSGIFSPSTHFGSFSSAAIELSVVGCDSGATGIGEVNRRCRPTGGEQLDNSSTPSLSMKEEAPAADRVASTAGAVVVVVAVVG